jgi:hypothetical protein
MGVRMNNVNIVIIYGSIIIIHLCLRRLAVSIFMIVAMSFVIRCTILIILSMAKRKLESFGFLSFLGLIS